MRRIFRIRNLLWLGAGIVLALGLLLASYRWWLPKVAPMALAPWGAQVDSVRWEGEPGHFRVEGLRFAQESVRIEADWIELPPVWTYFKSRGELRAGAVRIQVSSEGAADSVEGADDAVTTPDEAVALAKSVRGIALDWLPPVEVESLELIGTSDAPWLRASAIRYQSGQVATRVQTPYWPEPFQVKADVSDASQWQLVADSAAELLQVQVALDLSEASGFSLHATVSQQADSIEMHADWNGQAWLPEQASVRSAGLELKPDWLLRAGLSEVAQAKMDAIDMTWKDGRYRGRFGLTGQYATVEERAREDFEALLRFEGTEAQLTVQDLRVALSWAELNLSEAVQVDLTSGAVMGNAQLVADLDLGKQSYWELAGRLQMHAQVEALSRHAGLGAVRFEIKGDDLQYGAYQVAGVDGRGVWRDQILQLDALNVSLLPDAPESTVQGRIDFAAHRQDLKATLHLSPEWVNPLIGQTLLSQAVDVTGQLTGSFESPQLSADVVGQAHAYGFRPIDLTGAVRMDGLSRYTWQGRLATGNAAIELDLEVEDQAEAWRVHLSRFEWSDPTRPKLSLASPSVLRWDRTLPEEATWTTRLSLSPFRLSGEDLGLNAHYEPTSEEGLALEMRNVSMLRVNRWLETPLPEYTVDAVSVRLQQMAPYVMGTVALQVEEALPGDSLIRLHLDAAFQEQGLTCSTLNLQMDAVDLMSGSLQLPIRLAPEATPMVQVLDEAPLQGALVGEVSPALSDWLARQYGVALSEGSIDLNLGGRFDAPEGQLKLSLKELKMVAEAAEAPELPVVQNLVFHLNATPEELVLNPLSFHLRGASIDGALRLPVDALMEAIHVEGTRAQAGALLRQASANLQLSGWAMEDWIDFMPAMMRRTGTLDGGLELKPDFDLSGDLSFRNFALRPTATMPSVDRISGGLQLKGRQLDLSKGIARVGGHPVNFAGFINVSNWEQPTWQIHIDGEDVPLVRTGEMILRTDLDVVARTREASPPIVEGDLELRQSTLLLEIDPFAPSFESGSTRKPPYFSIPEAPFADWRFDLSIKGERFMRVRSAYVRALLSANFKLGGSFAYPELIGSVRAEDAELRFPGGNMRLSEAEAYIAPAQPDALQLNFKGVAQKSGHVISMEVSETLSNPHIQFQSTPELSNAEIIRLLATGSLSGGGLGSAGLYLGQGLLGSGARTEGFADRISIDVGEETSREGKNTIDIRYDLSDRWYLNGGYDRYDAYNLDLIWSIFKR